MDTYLPPIEKPRGIIMRLIYAATRRRFGKVLTPLKVHSARLPVAFAAWYGRISKLDGRLRLDPRARAPAPPPGGPDQRVRVLHRHRPLHRHPAVARRSEARRPGPLPRQPDLLGRGAGGARLCDGADAGGHTSELQL